MVKLNIIDGETAYETATSVKVTDPVCGMQINPATSAAHTEHAGQTYHFCNPGCLAKFRADPAKYLSPEAKPEASQKHAVVETIYTCPMHPEIRQKGPGICPKCGMSLEPVEVSAATEESNTELKAMSQKTANVI